MPTSPTAKVSHSSTPDDLTVMINRFHTIAGNPYTKISTLELTSQEADHLKVALIEKFAGTSGYCKITHRHLYVLENTDHLWLWLILP